MNYESDKYYELLGVAPGASAQELKDAYRDLAKVWHPDRFSHDPRLQQKAQEKLKEINEAYDRLTARKAGSRTRTAHAPREPQAPAAATVRRKRPRLVLLTATVFCAAFLAALSSLVSPGARPASDPTAKAERQEAPPLDDAQQPESVARTAAGRPVRGKEQTGPRAPSEATSGGEPGPKQSAPELRPAPTVTVTIDAATGLLATKDCPALSRMTYPSGGEPRRYCTALHKTKAADSGLKSVGKRLAAPVKWLGGEKRAEGAAAPEDK